LRELLFRSWGSSDSGEASLWWIIGWKINKNIHKKQILKQILKLIKISTPPKYKD